MANKTARFIDPRSRDFGGAGFLVILIVLAIILIVVGKGFFEKAGGPASTSQQVSQGITYIDRSADVTCQNNRNAIKTDLVQMRIMNDNKIPTIEEMRRRFGSQKCPRGGAFYIGQDGVVYCTKHFPPPVAELRQMVELHPAVPEWTPPPVVAATPMGTPTPGPDAALPQATPMP